MAKKGYTLYPFGQKRSDSTLYMISSIVERSWPYVWRLHICHHVVHSVGASATHNNPAFLGSEHTKNTGPENSRFLCPFRGSRKNTQKSWIFFILVVPIRSDPIIRRFVLKIKHRARRFHSVNGSPFLNLMVFGISEC